MVYFSSNAVPPAMTAGGAQSYQNPYYQASCGCGSGRKQVTEVPFGAREGFGVREHMAVGDVPAQAVQLQAGVGAAPMCTLTATAPPAGCCHPAPLHCDCCNGSGYFRGSEAYGS